MRNRLAEEMVEEMESMDEEEEEEEMEEEEDDEEEMYSSDSDIDKRFILRNACFS